MCSIKMMILNIFKDKFLGPILIIFCVSFLYKGKMNDWFFLLTLMSVLLTILCLIFYFKEDNYIINFSIESEMLKIEYQKNFSKNKVKIFSDEAKSIESIKFNSKSFLDTFHVISIKYKDNEGLYNVKTFKMCKDKDFTDILHYLQHKTQR